MSAQISFTNHLVAFIDVLGFAEMVRHDTEAGSGSRLFVEKLYEVNKQFAERASELGGDFQITQFSDSIVLSHPFVLSSCVEFFRAVSDLQLELLRRGLLCRGGVSYGKHFSEASFMFSDAMIAAYRIESGQARYPRIVVSSDLVELLDGQSSDLAELLTVEDDGAVFIDYIGLAARTDRAGTQAHVEAVLAAFGTRSPPALREKARWLAQYADAAIGTTLAAPRFAPLGT